MKIFLQRNSRDHQMVDLFTKRLKNGHDISEVWTVIHTDMFDNEISENLGEDREVECELEVL